MTQTGAYNAHTPSFSSAGSVPFRQDLCTSTIFMAACQAMMADVGLKAFRTAFQALPTTIGANPICFLCLSLSVSSRSAVFLTSPRLRRGRHGCLPQRLSTALRHNPASGADRRGVCSFQWQPVRMLHSLCLVFCQGKPVMSTRILRGRSSPCSRGGIDPGP